MNEVQHTKTNCYFFGWGGGCGIIFILFIAETGGGQVFNLISII